ncbi:MBL fold metallo-hydrolase [Microbacterium esteraromaticum]|uniref:MBL fold metallo-hydrolase n=1 Tax=Microbacterium esteraromaticum TaxID=57043 RepID=A0A939DY71_9MICO|nr:MBL fold metallo-hydrolase [Microbacterium esteraromaticum]MBN8206193.1 MBL fold metallo-hydrolase [Microbacterium esteraromaticum]MBN8416348.1 MBL fold metallo-hydrolase [Microbacterium esteraromaticum]MBN8423297.1 MBL fold metallo-hydrolase [Microbacterium esteraromaticum]
MLLERIYDEDLAQASYVIGCQAKGEAIVVDPRRDLDVYLDLAAKNGMKIVAVTETHIHADYLSGTRELAAATGATMYVSDEGGPDWTYSDAFVGAVRMKHGHRIALGNITVEAVHTPGHTPEHLSFLVTDGAQSSDPGFMLTGDFVFVGDLGRPDLLDEAAGFVDTRFAGAKDLFASLRDRFLTLPDYVQVLPAHGSGSACGKALGAIASTTVGYERNFSWWSRYLKNDDEQGFIDELLNGQPDAHAYFARMKQQNKIGPAVIGDEPELIEYTSERLGIELADDSVIFVDTRHNGQVHEGTVEGALNIPGVQKAASYGAWVYDPETEQRPLVLLAASRDEAEQMRDHLIRVGIDAVRGFITSLDGLDLVVPKLVQPEDLDGFEHVLLLDVRNKTEFAAGHLPGAAQLSGGRVLWNLDQLPAADAGTIVTYCQSGVRNSVAASALRRKGYDIAELDGSYNAWVQMSGALPVAA